jgi:molybdopterin molybdotransferase
MVSVEEAEQIILQHSKDYGKESVPVEDALGRVLAEDILADRDLPPFDRVTMDGIAIRYESFERGILQFRIKATQAAGQPPIDIESDDECIEIMTGAVLPTSTDTVLPYEDIDMIDGVAILKTDKVLAVMNSWI